jgi:hypothetical protein
MENKVAILLWLYHTDMAQEFYDILYKFKDISDIHLGLCIENDNRQALEVFKDLPSSVLYHHNMGGDILPFLKQLQNIDNPIFVKLHSKKSGWGINNQGNWRLMLLDSLLDTPKDLLNNIKRMQTKNIGYLGPPSFMCYDFELKNKEKIRELEYKLNIPKVTKRVFCGGNMFIGQTLLYKNILDHHYHTLYDLLSKETGKVSDLKSGTYCHAMERILGYISNNKTYSSGRCFINTIKIKILSKNTDHKYLHFRTLPNNDIYCVEQPNIYGKIIEQNRDDFIVQWDHKLSEKQKYQKISKNSYINTKHIR